VNLFNHLYVNDIFWENKVHNCIINVNLCSACSLFLYSNSENYYAIKFLKILQFCTRNIFYKFFYLSSILIIAVSNFVIRGTYQLNFATLNTFNFYILWLVFLVLLRMLRLLFSHKCRKLKYTINKFYVMFLLIICLQNFSYKICFRQI